ncbi:MAG TPA: hypothetical protein VHA10_02995 [Hypericibacter adhaerens]|uniref:hypothetical protein n=1 Tax=Hypericibacter adhaerens TaxID=2602016 RepID=UPI002CFC0477|nr:hypothetical protein [Hypericibacter adhaerens]HWA42149.1 hypothetical protein [Hypericibacter adhaerens]
MTPFRTILFTMAAAAILSLGAATSAFAAPPAGGGQCLSDQQIQSAIASGQIKSWPKIKKLARISADYQEVSDVKVCLVNGVPYYNVNLVSSNGDAKKIVLNALDGSG